MKRKLPFIIITIILLSIFGYSFFHIINYVIENQKIKNKLSQIEQKSNIKEINDTKKTKVIETVEASKIDPYWDFIKYKLIDVNIEKLKRENKDTVGWIQVLGTNINYPFVQTNNNEYYLTHSFDHSYNSAGWVFLDYRNNINIQEKNFIIYAHGRLDQTMFGSLKNILKSEWLKQKENYVVRISTEKYNALYQIFSVYHIPTTNDYLQIDFETEEEYKSLLDKLINRSMHNFSTQISSKDKILSLSTCYNEKEKMVMHAKLIKIEEK